MIISHNLSAMNAQRMYNINSGQKAKTAEKLSSGYRINRAADDAAGLAISEKMRRQVRGLSQAVLNSQDGISMVQTAEGALDEIHQILLRMNELSVKAANDTYTSEDRRYIQSELDALLDEVDRTGATTTFNEIKLLKGVRQSMVRANAPTLGFSGVSGGSLRQATDSSLASYTVTPVRDGDTITYGSGDSAVYYKVGATATELDDGSREHPYPIPKDTVYRNIATALTRANSVQTDSVTVTYSTSGSDEGKFTMEFHGALKIELQVGSEPEDDMAIKISPVNVSSLGLYDVNVTGNNAANALKSIECIKNAINSNSRVRSDLGAYQNRLEHTIRNLNNVVENTQAAESQIRDLDMAKEIMDNTNRDIILQAGQAVMAQANQSKEGVLSLLQ